MRRFFYQGDMAEGQTIYLSEKESHHLKTVLRARDGDAVILMDGNGITAKANYIDDGSSKRQPACCIIKECSIHKKPNDLTLYVSYIKQKMMLQVIKQATEMGVTTIQIIKSEHSDRKTETKHYQQWCDAAVEACKQSINPFLPIIKPIIDFNDALNIATFPAYLAAVPTGGKKESKCIVEHASLWVGPEGGFSENELKLLEDKSVLSISFSPWVLRAETAVVAGLSYINGRHR